MDRETPIGVIFARQEKTVEKSGGGEIKPKAIQKPVRAKRTGFFKDEIGYAVFLRARQGSTAYMRLKRTYFHSMSCPSFCIPRPDSSSASCRRAWDRQCR
jgi:hypothetical protein